MPSPLGDRSTRAERSESPTLPTRASTGHLRAVSPGGGTKAQRARRQAALHMNRTRKAQRRLTIFGPQPKESRFSGLISPMSLLRRWRELTGIKYAALDATSPLGAYLNEKELQELARACAIRTFKEGDSLPESPFYIVLDGAVTVMEATTGDVVCTRGQWSFFTSLAGEGLTGKGEEGMMRVGAAAPARGGASGTEDADILCVCREDSRVLLVANEDRLDSFYWGCSAEGQGGYDAIVHTNLANTLMEVPFISEADVDRPSLRKLGELCSYHAVQEGEWIFEAGDAVSALVT